MTEQLLAKATALAERISNSTSNAKKTGKDKRTAGFLEARIQLLNNYWDKYQEYHDELSENATAEELQQLYFKNDVFSNVECAYTEAMGWLCDELKQLKTTQAQHPADLFNSSSSCQDFQTLKLPKINIPTFTGSYIDWPPFRDIYSSLIHDNKSLTDIQKMHYLKSVLSGEAAKLLKHLAVTSTNYHAAWDLLNDRYQNKRLLVNSCLNTLISIQNMSSESPKEVRRVLDSFMQTVRALENLGSPIQHWNDWLVYVLSNKLDQATRKDWETSLGSSAELPTLESLRKYLESRLHTLEAIKYAQGTERKMPQHLRTTQTTSRIHHISSFRVCILCKGKHLLLFCPEFRTKSIEQRMHCVKEHKLCTNCLKHGHTVHSCPSSNRCRYCSQDHHSMLHKDTAAACNTHISQDVAPVTEPMMPTRVLLSEKTSSTFNVLLATAVVRVSSPTGRVMQARALLDQGSESSFITKSLSNLLGLQKKPVKIPVLGVGGCEAGVAESIVEHHITSLVNPSHSVAVQALVLSNLTNLIPSRKVLKMDWPHIKDLELADQNYDLPSRIDLILGADIYGKLLKNGVRHGPPGSPVAQNTALGWILSGTVSSESGSNHSNVRIHCSLEGDLNMLLRKFWELEAVPERASFSLEEEECEDIFKSTVQRDKSGRYITRLPVKSQNLSLGTSKETALSALIRMESRFKRDKQLQNLYVNFMDEYLHLNHMELVPDNEEYAERCYFLPHHAVLKPQSSTTKLRVVFNASSRTTTGISLNDILHVGPKVQNDVSVVILNWRLYPYVFCGDIEKMYRQILVDRRDVNLQRILWRRSTSDPISIYRLLTITYGMACAPYLACRTLQQLADDYNSEFPLGAAILRNNFYVDDALFGAYDKPSALQARDEIRALLHKGGFKLRKWLSNDTELLAGIPQTDIESCTLVQLMTDDQYKTLGIHWNPSTDHFSYQFTLRQSDKITKRNVLAEISRLYDPLGWLSPITITAKIFLQKLWLAGLEWDEELPLNLQNLWINYRQSLAVIPDIHIDRWLGTSTSHLSLEFHGYCDASIAAYGAVVYLRITHDYDNVQISLVAAKTKVSPLKTVSLPRLELCGAALLAQLLFHLQKSLHLEEIPVHTWTDSTIVLAWIRSHPSRWKTFVANRVSTIHEKLPTAVWHHVASQDNPADCLTRGMSPSELKVHDLWWTGPRWLSFHSSKWPTNPYEPTTEFKLEERIQSPTCLTSQSDPSLQMLDRYSTLQRLLRITAYCHRFLSNIRSIPAERKGGTITPSEINNALTFWIQRVQQLSFSEDILKLLNGSAISPKSKLRKLNPFLDSEQTLRVGGRLKNSLLTFNQKHPIILPKDSYLTDLIIKFSHDVTLHGGTQLTLHNIRNKYWIINGRSKVRKFVRNCVICYRHKARTRKQIMADLPADRVTPAKPFLNSGVDYAGPLNVKPVKGRGSRSIKMYVAVFVCLVTRAIHLELVHDLSAEAFIAAFKRFVARRGHCAKIYSDNATNFVSADKQLTQHLRDLMRSSHDSTNSLLTKEGTEWHFIPPAAPHFGGIWEAGVKSLKHHLRRVVGDHLLTIEEMLTLLAQIEACLNSRPLHPLSDDPEDLSVLTPGHFLIGDSLLSVPEPNVADVPINRLNRWQLVQRMHEQIWNRWRQEYMHHLQLRHKWTHEQNSVGINDLVLIKEDRLPPTKWLLGRIVKVHPGSDGNVRVVTVKHQTGSCKRPINKICVLPINS